MDEYPTTWEAVSTDNSLETLRLRVPGGWLVNVRDELSGDTNTLLVDDPQGTWKLES